MNKNIITSSLILLASLLSLLNMNAQEYMPLWPDGKMPNSQGKTPERIEARERVTQIDVPGMYVYLTARDVNTRGAVLICPSGGYQKLTYKTSGMQIAKWLNTLGINAFVLMYRLPNSPDLRVSYEGPVQDAQRAMKLIRAHADQWEIDANNLGVFGSSAGGHLATTICTIADDFSNIGDSLDAKNFRPDFQILVSPVVSLVKDYHKGSRLTFLGDRDSEELAERFSNERNVTDETPPCFLVHADNDHGVSPMNSVRYYTALNAHNIPASLHIFPYGGHGIGIRNNPGSTQQWPVLCEAWLKEMGFLKPVSK
ncbi:alpha/beta hydrolase [Saccharicrinis sp. FJH54]|uniref:alpha/beta hydrolase n=1 Tax=Saccharicrinis sp. FJH54 TaxID=3344665 RepID=UPI0035D44980